jgi:ABC-type transport system involved in cytochrome c biogenesis permease subunit
VSRKKKNKGKKGPTNAKAGSPQSGAGPDQPDAGGQSSAPSEADQSASDGAAGSSKLTQVFPWAMLAVFVLYLVSGLPVRSGDSEFDYQAFGRLPVSYQGRIQPLDSVARNSLMIISGRQTVTLHGKEDRPAIEWLVSTMAEPKSADLHQVIRIDHPDIKGLLGFPTEKKLFSIESLRQNAEKLQEQFQQVQGVPHKERSLYQKRVAELEQKLQLYLSLQNWGSLHVAPPFEDGQEWRTLVHLMHEGPRDERAMDTYGAVSQAFKDGDQESLKQAMDQYQELMHPSYRAYFEILTAYKQRDATSFNQSVEAYTQVTEAALPGDLQRTGFEQGFNRYDPFLKCMAIYVFVFVLVCVSWVIPNPAWSRALEQSAFWLLALTLLVHSAGLTARVYISERPPVTNLYSSAVFIGWGAALMCLVLERLFKNSLGSLLAATIGFSTLLIGRALAEDGDTMAMLQAVLDTNFWLATHVVVISLGYSATFLAGFLGIAYVLRGMLTTSLNKDAARSMQQMNYGIVCFAILFSFVGTILGGLWADQSWGRFWGWDPKENGALLIVLWNALVLHARWGGMVKQRGFMVLTVFGNIITAWSWFGTNMLGVGLHSYGFMDAAFKALVGFCSFNLLVILVGSLVPVTAWRSSGSLSPKTQG